MNGTLTVKRLSCPHCGAELEGGSQYITFQCGSCFNHFIITGKGLEAINIITAIPESGLPQEIIFLPFWSVGIDREALKEKVAKSISLLRNKNGTIAATRLEEEKEEDFRLFTREKKTGMEKIGMIAKIPPHRSVPGEKEIEHLLSEINAAPSFAVYVPAFKSGNPFSYLKVGRLLTASQPAFARERSTAPGRSASCVIDREEAESLIDLVFFSTLSSRILACGEFLEGVSLKPSGRTELLNFPFRNAGRAVVSLIGGFSFSPRILSEPLSQGQGK